MPSTRSRAPTLLAIANVTIEAYARTTVGARSLYVARASTCSSHTGHSR
jgi:hypothetical protein